MVSMARPGQKAVSLPTSESRGLTVKSSTAAQPADEEKGSESPAVSLNVDENKSC
jgi:hypothetical protein